MGLPYAMSASLFWGPKPLLYGIQSNVGLLVCGAQDPDFLMTPGDPGINQPGGSGICNFPNIQSQFGISCTGRPWHNGTVPVLEFECGRGNVVKAFTRHALSPLDKDFLFYSLLIEGLPVERVMRATLGDRSSIQTLSKKRAHSEYSLASAEREILRRSIDSTPERKIQ